MVPIALASVAVIAIGISRYVLLSREKKLLGQFVNKWKHAPTTIDPDVFLQKCEDGPNFCTLFKDLPKFTSAKKADITSRLESLGHQELARLENGIGTIGTLAAATPLVGFLGTVTGMIRAFMQIQNLGGNVNANVLAGGIWEALVTTAAGLAVGILALIIHNYLVGLVKKSANDIEICGEFYLRIVESDNEA